MKKNIQKYTTALFWSMLIVLLLLGNTSAVSQISKQQSYKLLKISDNAYNEKKFAVAANNYEVYLNKSNDKSNYLVINKLLDCYLQMRAYSLAMETYEKIENKSNLTFANNDIKIKISDMLARYGKYEEASTLLKTVNGYEEKNEGFSPMEIEDMKRDSTKWKIVGLNFNTKYREYAPFLQNSMLIFSSNRPESVKKTAYDWDGNNYSHLWQTDALVVDTTDLSQEDNTSTTNNTTNKDKKLSDIYVLSDNEVFKGHKISRDKSLSINPEVFPSVELLEGTKKLKYNTGSISLDKNNHAYFSANSTEKDKDGFNKVCIKEGDYKGNIIENIKSLDLGNGAGTEYSVMHPAVNNDGTVLVFSSNKKGGAGGYDLYFLQRADMSKSWGAVRSFKSGINTVGNEVYPMITKDGFLYFSSDAKSGLGGLDLYRANLNDVLANKGKVEHLQYPINSGADDFGWTQDNKGDKCFFTSDRYGDNDNIFMAIKSVTKPAVKPVTKPATKPTVGIVEVIKRPTNNHYLIGYVKDKVTDKPLEGADVFLLEKGTDNIAVAQTDSKGKYMIPVQSDGPVQLKATKADLGNDCVDLNIKRDPNDSILRVGYVLSLGNIYRVGYTWKLENIHYDFNKWDIRPDARPILDKVVEILKKYPITIELSSHTDSRGNDQYNMRLSELRAKSAVNYIVSKGIEVSRLKAKGYGETQLLNKCGNGVPCSEAEHQVNRRTEVKVLNYVVPNNLQNINTNYVITGKKIKLSDLPKDFFEKCTNEDTEENVPDIREGLQKVNLSNIESTNSNTQQNINVQTESIKNNYYVVVSSSSDKNASEIEVQKLTSLGYHAVLLDNNGIRYRVAVPCASQTEAEQYKAKLQTLYKDAWILNE